MGYTPDLTKRKNYNELHDKLMDFSQSLVTSVKDTDTFTPSPARVRLLLQLLCSNMKIEPEDFDEDVVEHLTDIMTEHIRAYEGFKKEFGKNDQKFYNQVFAESILRSDEIWEIIIGREDVEDTGLRDQPQSIH
ncbi:hypothetical protein H1S01_19855 [Heliobacterium chlorum]|uniref:Uncharacterized protein n=1 Tax=Heliobacterium chlorum TaxID=2698 RepID=A0ABR7T9B6_HELCL|nr:hypothetical protein [Heliobacterium chlorum]MBC9786700.1 hypothetical protein [Heliobacterium chlorum]